MDNPYKLGILSTRMPIPIRPENCVFLDAGPVRFVVEPRILTDEVMHQHNVKIGQPDLPPGWTFDDSGASLHVFGIADGLEHLRFDCFTKDAHYHYIRQLEQEQQVCPFDVVANGDPIEWAVTRLNRLPEMLEFAGAPELAAAVRLDLAGVLTVANQLELALRQASEEVGVSASGSV